MNIKTKKIIQFFTIYILVILCYGIYQIYEIFYPNFFNQKDYTEVSFTVNIPTKLEVLLSGFLYTKILLISFLISIIFVVINTKKNQKMNDLENYWDEYENLIQDLTLTGSNKLANELKKIKSKVFGLTDGWFEFKNDFENLIKINIEKMTENQKNKAKSLIKKLNSFLKN
ncbi:hypothetical protein PG326_00015 [Riemerella anatipestifer]|nr:hypothetical protein [Riemerella anatipestifer]MDY3356721.1 hypothetical protein [Riemerella anatipestifer]